MKGASAFYFVSTPYIDAYDTSHEEAQYVDFDRFVVKMQDQAYSWGEQGQGRAALSVLEPAAHDGRLVLAFGVHGDKKYVAVQSSAGAWKADVVEVEDIPHEWDVTG